jgi:hypothetical protein
VYMYVLDYDQENIFATVDTNNTLTMNIPAYYEEFRSFLIHLERRRKIAQL